jgi:hypothetical protein
MAASKTHQSVLRADGVEKLVGVAVLSGIRAALLSLKIAGFGNRRLTGAESYSHIRPQRLRLDRDREASHDLNRLLDKSGSESGVVPLEISFCPSPHPRAFRRRKPSIAGTAHRHCNGASADVSGPG